LSKTLTSFIRENLDMTDKTISCYRNNCSKHVEVREDSVVDSFLSKLKTLYDSTTAAGDSSTQYWVDIAVNSEHPLAPLAHIPGVFAALWTPEVAPSTAVTLATAGYGFAALPKNLVHFTTVTGSRGIASTGTINASKIGLFGPDVYLTSVGRPVNLFVRASAKTPIIVSTPAGTVRILPKLVYVRWGLSPLVLP
jgi:hypothetical protein